MLAPKGTAAGGAFSTAADLQRFWLGLVDGDLLPAAQSTMVLRGYEDDATMPQGRMALAGGAPGVLTVLFLNPATRDFSVALCNYDTPLGEEILRHLESLGG